MNQTKYHFLFSFTEYEEIFNQNASIQDLVKALEAGGYNAVSGSPVNLNEIYPKITVDCIGSLKPEPFIEGSLNGKDWIQILDKQIDIYPWIREVNGEIMTLIKRPFKEALSEFKSKMYLRSIKVRD